MGALRSSYWLLPSFLALGAIALCILTLHIDPAVSGKWARGSVWL